MTFKSIISYYLRVFFVSFEALLLVLFCVSLNFFGTDVSMLFDELKINEDFYKYLMFLPFTICVWVIKGLRDLVFSDIEQRRVLINWPFYWKLKTHIVVGFFYSILFCVLGVMPLILNLFHAKLFLAVSILGVAIVAVNVYFAQMKIQEILSFEHD